MLTSLSVSVFLLGFSIMSFIAGVAMSFSKKERERIQKRAAIEQPERRDLIMAPDALKKNQRRGYITLVVGVISFVAWLVVFGPTSLIM